MSSQRSVLPFPQQQPDPQSTLFPYSEFVGQPVSAVPTQNLQWFISKGIKSPRLRIAVQIELEKRNVAASTSQQIAAAAPQTPTVSAPPMTAPATQPSSSSGGWRSLEPKPRQVEILRDRGVWKDGLTRGECSNLLDLLLSKGRAR